MKKFVVLGLLFCSSIFVYAQKTDSTYQKAVVKGRNELKLNLAYAIAGFPEINYERILNNNNGIGLAIIIGLESHLDYKFGLITHYRVYFGKQKANGFFIEGNAAMISRELYYYTVYDKNGNVSGFINNKIQTRFGLGAATGVKLLTKRGFVGEAYVGLGGLYGSNKIDNYLRSGVTIGKRF